MSRQCFSPLVPTFRRLRRSLLRLDGHIAAWARRHGRWGVPVHEFFWFGVKQAWACLFGGLMVGLLFATWRWYPHAATLTRYDFLTLAAVSIQALLLGLRLETRREALVILMFHGVGTAMELFKTSVGSWVYPEESVLHIGGVPLFTGFMYACIGSYIARAWRLFEFRFDHHPSLWACAALSCAIYVNFFAHHYMPDLRIVLFALVLLTFGRTWVYYRIRTEYRRMPLLLGFFLVAVFIWLAENAGTFTRAWQYPSQRHGWSLVPVGKLGAWLLLMIISYVLVAMVNRRDTSPVRSFTQLRASSGARSRHASAQPSPPEQPVRPRGI